MLHFIICTPIKRGAKKVAQSGEKGIAVEHEISKFKDTEETPRS